VDLPVNPPCRHGGRRQIEILYYSLSKPNHDVYVCHRPVYWFVFR
jgi:hypothetical protein